MNPKVYFQAGLSNGETATEGRGAYTVTTGELSPWQRLLAYCRTNNLVITSLSLCHADGRRWNLPSLGRLPIEKFIAEADEKKCTVLSMRVCEGKTVTPPLDAEPLPVEGDLKTFVVNRLTPETTAAIFYVQFPKPTEREVRPVYLPVSNNNPKYAAFFASKPVGYKAMRKSAIEVSASGVTSQPTDHFAVIEAQYDTHRLQVWVDELTLNSWSVII